MPSRQVEEIERYGRERRAEFDRRAEEAREYYRELLRHTDEVYRRAMAQLEEMDERRTRAMNSRPPSLLPELLKRIERMDEERGQSPPTA